MNELTLFELTKLKREIDELLQLSLGEITPEIENKLQITEEALPQKLDSYYHVITGAAKEAEYWRAEARKLDQVAKGYETLQDRLKQKILEAMQSMGLEKVSGLKSSFRVSDSPVSVFIDDNAAIPADCQIVKVTPDKAAIKAKLLNMQDIPGCRLVTNKHLRVTATRKTD